MVTATEGAVWFFYVFGYLQGACMIALGVFYVYVETAMFGKPITRFPLTRYNIAVLVKVVGVFTYCVTSIVIKDLYPDIYTNEPLTMGKLRGTIATISICITNMFYVYVLRLRSQVIIDQLSTTFQWVAFISFWIQVGAQLMAIVVAPFNLTIFASNVIRQKLASYCIVVAGVMLFIVDGIYTAAFIWYIRSMRKNNFHSPNIAQFKIIAQYGLYATCSSFVGGMFAAMMGLLPISSLPFIFFTSSLGFMCCVIGCIIVMMKYRLNCIDYQVQSNPASYKNTQQSSGLNTEYFDNLAKKLDSAPDTKEAGVTANSLL